LIFARINIGAYLSQVHEHGHRGLDSNAEAELAHKREQIAKEHKSTHDEETKQTSLRPNVEVHQRTNVVEEVSCGCCFFAKLSTAMLAPG